MVVIDGIVEVIAQEEKTLAKICDFTFSLILETATCLLKSESRVRVLFLNAQFRSRHICLLLCFCLSVSIREERINMFDFLNQG